MANKISTLATGLLGWIDARFPLSSNWKAHLSEYYAPKNFNFWYFFGSLAMVVLVIQLLTGIFLAMHYKPDALSAFSSVEYIMRDVPLGWIIRYMHSTGASAFFVVVYLHMFRGLLYGSYKKPRELVWIIGCLIFLCLMGEAFFGYLLPWGQMSFWGAQVIVNLFSAIPFVGPDLSLLIRGDYVVSDATLNRFFSFHVIAIPLSLLGLVGAHILALHEVGSGNPDGVDIKAKTDSSGKPLDGIPFHPFYTVHDLWGLSIFLIVFCFVVFFAPELGGYFLEANNFIPADPLKTPAHIAPVWYFTPFYSILRAVTADFLFRWATPFLVAFAALSLVSLKNNLLKVAVSVVCFALILGFFLIEAKFWGVVGMGAAVLVLLFLPWIDRSPVRSIRYRPVWHRYVFGVFVLVFFMLGYFGTRPPEPLNEFLSKAGALVYFSFFLLMPWWSKMGVCKSVPERVVFHSHV